MNQTPAKLIFIIVCAIAILAFAGVATLCMSFFMHSYADPAILTAIITITSNLTGSLMTLLVSPRSQPPATSQTTTTTTTPATPPVPTAEAIT